MKKSFIAYPKTKINLDDQSIEVVDAPIKVKLNAFITGYKEDYGELPTIEYLQAIFKINKQDAEMALILYK